MRRQTNATAPYWRGGILRVKQDVGISFEKGDWPSRPAKYFSVGCLLAGSALKAPLCGVSRKHMPLKK